MKKFLKVSLLVLATLVTLAASFLGYKFLTLPEVTGSEPSWRADCKKIAFVAEKEDGYQLYILDLQSNEVEKVTTETGRKHYPVWSPDGSALAFCQKIDGDWWISTLDLNSRRITPLVETHTFNPMRPSWISANELVYPSSKSDDKEIWKYNLVTKEETMLTSVEEDDSYPHFVPTTNKIVFNSYRDGNSEIYLMNIDGSQQTRLTENENYDGRPWSDESGSITFISKVGESRSINRISPEGEMITLAQFENRIHYSTTCSTGERIIFTSDAEGDFALYEYDIVGKESKRIQPSQLSARD